MMQVAVIGAGLAGLRAARRLADAGHAVRIFDKSRGVGGRMSTRRTDRGTFDHGAQYFTVTHPAFRRQVEEWLERGVAARWEGRVVRLCEGVAKDEAPRERFVGTPRMNAVARDLLGDLPIDQGVRIETLRRAGERLALRCDAGFEQGDFDRVLVAVPPAQALPLLALADDLLARAADALMLPCFATLLDFEEPVPVLFDGAFVEGASGDALAWVARDDSKPGRIDGARWVLHAGAEWSEAHVDTAPEDVGAALTLAFERAIGRPLPPLHSRATHRWLYARPHAPADPGPCFDAASGIGLCGDWLQGDRVEDAFLSGDRVADAILGVDADH